MTLAKLFEYLGIFLGQVIAQMDWANIFAQLKAANTSTAVESKPDPAYTNDLQQRQQEAIRSGDLPPAGVQ